MEPLSALEKESVRLALPDAGSFQGSRQVDVALALTRLQHRRNQQPVTQHELVVNPAQLKMR